MVPLIIELNEKNYKQVSENGYVLVDIYAGWCQPCKQLSPIIDEISIDFQGKLTVCKLDAVASTDIVSELGVRNIPTILLYKDGEIIERNAGMISKDKLTELIESYM